jgi:hypothetical protein
MDRQADVDTVRYGQNLGLTRRGCLGLPLLTVRTKPVRETVSSFTATAMASDRMSGTQRSSLSTSRLVSLSDLIVSPAIADELDQSRPVRPLPRQELKRVAEYDRGGAPLSP